MRKNYPMLLISTLHCQTALKNPTIDATERFVNCCFAWRSRMDGSVSYETFMLCLCTYMYVHASMTMKDMVCTYHFAFDYLVHISGPFGAILTALGGKYVADRNTGPIRDSSLAVGRIAAAAGRKAKEERLICKLKAAIRSLFNGKKDCKCNNCGAPVNQSSTCTAK